LGVGQIRSAQRMASQRDGPICTRCRRSFDLHDDFEAPGKESRVRILHPEVPLHGMEKRLTRDDLLKLIAVSRGDRTWLWENYLAWCWINRVDARAWFEKQDLKPPSVLVEPTALSPSNRSAQAGGMAQVDEPFLNEMADLIKSGKARSVDAAAREVAPRAPGYGTPESKATRLAKTYRERQKSERPRSE
jgi:hypothetical protein